MSVRVPVMTIGSDSGAGVGDESWAQIDVARNGTKKNSERFFCTSNPPVSRGELAAEPFAPLSFFFLRRSFFAVRPGLADSGIGLQRTRTQEVKSGFSATLANEADRFEYSGSWLAVRTFRTLLFPAFTDRRGDRLARGKSYPVTAAQLLRFHTGFLAPIHCFKLANN